MQNLTSDRVFLKMDRGTILDVRGVKRTGDGISGRVANGDYPIELIDGVMFIPGYPGNPEPATNVICIYQGAPPIDRPLNHNRSVEWIKANPKEWKIAA